MQTQDATQAPGEAGFTEDDVRFLNYVRLTKENLAASFVDYKLSELSDEFTGILGIGKNVAGVIFALLVAQLAAARNGVVAPKEVASFLRTLATEIETNADFARHGHLNAVPVRDEFQRALIEVRYGVQRWHEEANEQKMAQLREILAGAGVQIDEPQPGTVQ